jgi:transposase-like protein
VTEQMIDVVAGLVRRQSAGGRNVYDNAAKAQLVRVCQRPGVSVAKMAMAHGVNANLLRKWMTQTQESQALRSVALVPVRTGSAHRSSAPDGGYLELVVAGGTLRVHGQVSVTMLQRALQCLTRHP